MQQPSATYSAAAAQQNLSGALFVLAIEGYAYKLTMGNTGRTNERAWISDIGDWSVGVDELNGSYSIDDLNVTVLDVNGQITADVHTYTFEQRRCSLLAGFDGMALADYNTLFSGIVAEVAYTKSGAYTFTCQDFNRLAQRLVYTRGDNTTVTTAVTTLSGNVYTTVSTAVTTNRTTGQTSTTSTTTTSLNGTVGTTVTTNSAAIGNNNLRHVVGHPLDILVYILLQEIGFASGDVNVAQINAYRDQVFAGVEFEFIIDSAVDAKTFIEDQLLKPLGGYMYPNNYGVLCVGFLQPNTSTLTAVMDVNDTNLQDLPDITPQQLVNVLTMRFDKDDTNSSDSSTGYLAEANTFYTPSIQNLADLTGLVAQAAAQNSGAVQGQLIIESDGMRSGFQGYLLAKMVANSIFSKYGNYNPSMDVALHWYPAHLLTIGDFVTVTHALLTDKRTGTVGIVGVRYQVVKRGYSFKQLTANVTLNDASGIRTYDAHRIAPNGTGAYTAVDAAAHARYIFASTPEGKQSNGDTAATLG